MKIVVLTTQTLHHAYFVRELDKAFPVDLVIVETRSSSPAFETSHAFECRRDEYDADEFFDGKNPDIGEFVNTKTVSSVNDAAAAAVLKQLKPDVVIVFGTGKVSAEVIACCPEAIVNLHGGDPEHYRGLDSHLWAIYHNDFNLLITTLHCLNQDLDDGDIILQQQLEIQRNMPLYALRKVNTNACIMMALTALDMFDRFGAFISRRQQMRGRYYSFMPTQLKEICLKKFERFTASL